MSIKAKIILVAEDRVTLELEDGSTFALPVFAFEGTPTVGVEVGLVAAVLGSEDAGRQALAKDLLNQLLKP